VVKERFAGTQRLFYDARKAQRMMRKQRRRAAAMSAAARAGFMGQQHTNLAVTLALAEDDEEDKGKANIIQRTYYAAKRAITVFMVKRVAADELNARINSHTASGANSVRSNATARSGRSGHGLGEGRVCAGGVQGVCLLRHFVKSTLWSVAAAMLVMVLLLWCLS
jgi:hypothetical protein